MLRGPLPWHTRADTSVWQAKACQLLLMVQDLGTIGQQSDDTHVLTPTDVPMQPDDGVESRARCPAITTMELLDASLERNKALSLIQPYLNCPYHRSKSWM